MFYGPKPTKSYVARTRHFWRRVGVGHVSDTGTGTTRRIPVSGECPLVFFFVSPTRADAALTRLRRFRHASSEEKKENFGIFRVIPAISAEMKISSDTRFLLEKKKKKIKIKILPPPSGFRAFLPPHLLLNFGLFFFFFFFWFRSATWLPLLLYLCVLAVLHLCLEFRI